MSERTLEALVHELEDVQRRWAALDPEAPVPWPQVNLWREASTRLLLEIAEAPIGSAADAALKMRAMMVRTDGLQAIDLGCEPDDAHLVTCLRQVAAWLEATSGGAPAPAADRPLDPLAFTPADRLDEAAGRARR